ncbi:MAG: DUF4111 domain-containing protein [Candidatus Pacebacteria bacterium]|nr:DUF4111 domain-containing protein [Candidatus Paceibacterota bacterium]
MKTNNTIVRQQIDDCVTLLHNTLRDDLLGIYVYGSLLMDGLQKFSDIDLFAISQRETTKEEKIQLEKALLKISGIYTISKDLMPIELTIIVKSHINPWHYPPTFDFLYGDWMRKDFEAGIIEPWPTKVMPNLALVITQLLLSNKILFGPDPKTLLAPIPYKDFILATTEEIDSLLADLGWDTRNVLLTFARIWSTIETDTIRSKANAVSWAIDKLPDELKPPLLRAKSIMLGEQDEHWDDVKELVIPCANFMIEQIKEHMMKINSTNLSGKSIKIA